MSPSLWSIYHIDNCKQSTPNKNKFVVVICDNPEIMGFFINSKINDYVSKRDWLKNLQVSIDSSSHPCLNKDSYVDCAGLKTGFSRDDFTDFKGKISLEVKEQIKDKVRLSIEIPNRYKKMILNEQ